MRVLIFIVLGMAGLVAGEASAQDWKTLSAVDQEARWNACYKETRLIYRTRNMSGQSYRVMIKDARRAHMQECMARPAPPRPIALPKVDEKKTPSTIAGWSANP
jgi:hypothetical protein